MRAVVVGSSGRMGQEIIQILNENSHEYFAVNSKHPLSQLTEPADVVIDFSLPQAMGETLRYCREKKLPLVSGVTGVSQEVEEDLRSLSQEIAVVWSANMSIGVAWLLKTLRGFKELSGFDFQIVETHHSKKIDKPSGTAKWLQEELVSVAQSSVPEPLAIRGGGVFGNHQIWAHSEEESLLLEHRALNRTVFAKGAVRAAEWICGQKPGLYDIRDVLEG